MSLPRHEMLLCISRDTEYCSAFPGAQNPALLFQGHKILLCFFTFLPATAQGGSDVSGLLPRVGMVTSWDRSCAVGGHDSSKESLLSPAAPELSLSIPFMLSHLALTLFFVSWTFLPLGYPLSLMYLSAHFILRAQPGLFQSPADP